MSTIKRKKSMLTVTISKDLAESLQDWIKNHPVPPAKNAVVETAIREFIDRQSGVQRGAA